MTDTYRNQWGVRDDFGCLRSEFINLPRKYRHVMEMSMLPWHFYGVGVKGKVRKKKGKEGKTEKRYR